MDDLVAVWLSRIRIVSVPTMTRGREQTESREEPQARAHDLRPIPSETYGNAKRSNSPSSATADGSWAGRPPCQRRQVCGTRRVFATGTAIQPSAVSSRE